MIGKVTCVVLDNDTLCLNGWDGTRRKPSCNYTGGHFCDLLRDHKGRCRCSCGATTTRNRWKEEEEQQRKGSTP